jgi:dTDP-4-dehydrorhamnose reductase
LAIQRHATKYIIMRTAWVFSEYGNNFLKTMLRLAKERDTLGVVADQIGCPTYAGDIAQALISIARQLHESEEQGLPEARYGIYHYAADEAVSWHGFAMAIFEEAHQQGALANIPVVNAIATQDYPTPAKRPTYSVLSAAKIAVDYAVSASEWRLALTKLVRHVVD